LIKGIVLRRDISILKHLLPGKDDNIVFCPMTNIQEKIYKRLLESKLYTDIIKLYGLCECGSRLRAIECCLQENDSNEEENNIKIENKRKKLNLKKIIFPRIITLQKLCQHPKLLEPNKDSEGDQYKNAVEVRDVGFGDEMDKITKLIKENRHLELSGKMRALDKLFDIWYNQKRKVLLFSTSTKILDVLQKFIDGKKYGYSRLDGKTAVNIRQNIIDEYSELPIEKKYIFLISTKAGSLGLNITSANVVVVFDASWNVSHDLQAQNRAYRIGQQKHTDIYRLICTGTIEEVIYNRQVYKQQMANVGLQGIHERRYYQGVQGVKGEEGELFGLFNLLKLTTDKVMSRDIIKTAEEEEKIYDIEKN